MAIRTVPMEQAQAELDRLIDEAMTADEVMVTRGDTPVVRLVAVAPLPKRQFGRWRGLIHIADDFDAPLDLTASAR